MRTIGSSNDRYLHVGLIVLGISGSAAAYLNFEGVSCLTTLNRGNEQVFTQQSLVALQEKCFIVTNAYVYSIFAVVAGLALVVIWIIKKKRAESEKGTG
jgi:hypothetical protein